MVLLLSRDHEKIRQMETSRHMERFFPSRVIKSFPCRLTSYILTSFFKKKLSIVIMTITLDEKLPNCYEHWTKSFRIVTNQCTLVKQTLI